MKIGGLKPAVCQKYQTGGLPKVPNCSGREVAGWSEPAELSRRVPILGNFEGRFGV